MKTAILAAALSLLGGYQGEARKADPAFTASASRAQNGIYEDD